MLESKEGARMGSSQGSQPDWEKPQIVELDEAGDAAGSSPCSVGSGGLPGPLPCSPGSAPIGICTAGTGIPN